MTTDNRISREYVDNQNITLKEHITEVFKEFKDSLDSRFKVVDTRFISIDKAIELARNEADIRVTAAREASEKRLDILNEFRKTVEDWTENAATKESVQSLRLETKLLTEKLESLERNNYERIDNEIENLKLSRAELSGKAATWQVVVAYVIAVIGIILNIIK